MIHKVLVTLAVAAALALSPLTTIAHEGHEHGVKAKKIKKSKAKKTAVEFTLRRNRMIARPASLSRARPRQKCAIIRRPLTTR